MQNQLVVHNQSVSDITAMAQAITKSGLFGIKQPEQAVALMLVAQSEGRHPASVASEFDIIQNRPALKSQAALARFQNAGGRVQWVERTDSKVVLKGSHPAGGELTVEWTWEMAEKAGLTGKQTWKQWPRQMLSARAQAELVRALYPACLNGIYLVEEVQDFDAKPKAAKATIELVQDDSSAKEVPSLPDAPKEATPYNGERPDVAKELPVEIVSIDTNAAPIEAEEISWEANWWTPEVESALSAIEDKANAFLLGRDKIIFGQTWRNVSDETYRKNICSGLARFIKAVEKEVK